MNAPFVILACGNPSRGDDALGPLLLSRLQGWLEEVGASAQFELIEDFQFQVEHALDLEGRELAVFIDAGEGTVAPYLFSPLVADGTPGHSTHAISPAAVLDVYQRILHAPPPPAHVLCVRGERFELGEGLSEAAQAHFEAAWLALRSFCHELLQIPQPTR